MYIISATVSTHSTSDPDPATPNLEGHSGETCQPRRISRRQFAQKAAAAAAASLAPATIFTMPARSAPLARPPAAEQAAKSGLTPEQTQEVEARLANVVRKYGDRLSEDQRQHLRRILTYNEKLLTAIRSFPLKNSDAPASVLKLATGKQSRRADSGGMSSAKSGRGNVRPEVDAS